MRNRSKFMYPDLASARRPVPHCDDIPVPVFGYFPDITNEDSSSVEERWERRKRRRRRFRRLWWRSISFFWTGAQWRSSRSELIKILEEKASFLSDSIRIMFSRNKVSIHFLLEEDMEYSVQILTEIFPKSAGHIKDLTWWRKTAVNFKSGRMFRIWFKNLNNFFLIFFCNQEFYI